MPISAIDYFAGSLAFGSVLTAIMARGAGAGGQLVDVSLFDAAVNFLSPFLSGAASDNYRVQRAGADNPMAYPFSVFETSNGHVSLGVGNDGAWRRFCDALDIPDVCERYPRMEDRLAARETLDPIMKDTLRRFTSEEVTKRLELARVPATAVRTPGDLVRDPFSEERGAVEWLTAKDADSRVVVAASPIRLSKTPGRMWRLPPSIGENNDDYRSAWLSAVPDESSQD
jgi:formyl-CoA transferase